MKKQENLKRGSSNLKKKQAATDFSTNPGGVKIQSPAEVELLKKEKVLSEKIQNFYLNLAAQLEQISAKKKKMDAEFVKIPVLDIDGIPISREDVIEYLIDSNGEPHVMDDIMFNYQRLHPNEFKFLSEYREILNQKSSIMLELDYRDGASPEAGEIMKQRMDFFKEFHKTVLLNDRKINQLATLIKSSFMVVLSRPEFSSQALNLAKLSDTEYNDFIIRSADALIKNAREMNPFLMTKEVRSSQAKQSVDELDTNFSNKLDLIDLLDPNRIDSKDYANYRDGEINFNKSFFKQPRNLDFFVKVVSHELTHYFQDYNITTMPEFALNIIRNHYNFYNTQIRTQDRLHEQEAVKISERVSNNFKNDLQLLLNNQRHRDLNNEYTH